MADWLVHSSFKNAQQRIGKVGINMEPDQQDACKQPKLATKQLAPCSQQGVNQTAGCSVPNFKVKLTFIC